MKEQIEEMEMTPLDVLANDIYQHCPDLKDNYCGDTHCVSCLANALYNADYRKQEWIGVDERLPDNYRAVLVACEGTTIGGAAPIAIGSYGGGFWSLEDADGIHYFTKYMHVVVTHWMPLPETPKMKGGAE